ncbi:MAG: class I SAM-dependent methyltransferase [Casimicrobiaceae bacterium]
MPLPRRVEPEMLDLLPKEDPRAIRSRHDLRRINRFMATRSILRRGIDAATGGRPPRRVVELGAGDATLLLWHARQRAAQWPGVELTVVDRLDIIAAETRRAFAALGWTLRVVARDVFDWIEETPSEPYDLVLTNLFLHHFADDALQRLLTGVAERSVAFVACEPRRTATTLIGSHLVGLLGCNAVSRNDAVLSVHAGFRDTELAAAWPKTRSWRVDEYPAGLFSHCFWATRFE